MIAPARMRRCHCGTGKVQYNRCCLAKDIIKKAQTIEDIRNCLDNGGELKKKEASAGGIIFV